MSFRFMTGNKPFWYNDCVS